MKELQDISEYISISNPINAKRFIESLIDRTTLQLETFPFAGRVIPEINNPECRELLFRSYRVMYIVNNEVIRVASIQSSRQQFRPFA